MRARGRIQLLRDALRHGTGLDHLAVVLRVLVVSPAVTVRRGRVVVTSAPRVFQKFHVHHTLVIERVVYRATKRGRRWL